jgi:dihydrofolate reductase
MKKINVFDYVTLDGFFAGPHGETDWFKGIKKDKEFDEYTHTQSKSDNILVFGRRAYELMKSYWSTTDAIKSDPRMAKVMNDNQKIVFSKTLTQVKEDFVWRNIRLYHERAGA